MRAVPPVSCSSARLGIVTALVVLAMGCGRPGPADLFEVKGRATFAGRPIPAGRIVFEPDRGADGMVSIADILDGTYRTRPGRGFGGGRCQATVYGSDGTMPTEEVDTALFAPWTTTLDLPRADCIHDFTVPTTR